MSFGSAWGSVRRFPVIRSFAQCEAYFNATPAIRGHDKDTYGVPLRSDRRNHQYMSLIRRRDGAYAGKLYHTDVVTYHKDERIVVDVTYGSVSTREFAGALMPYGVRPLSLRGKDIVTDARGAYYAGRNPLELVKGTNDEGIPIWLVNRESTTCPIPPMGVQRTNRKVSGPIRKRIKPMLDYAATMAGLTAERGLDEGTVIAMRGEHGYLGSTLHLVQSLAAFEDEAYWPAIVAAFIRSSYRSNFSRYGNFINLSALVKGVTERAYTLGGAYYMEPLPIGVVHPKMMTAPL